MKELPLSGNVSSRKRLIQFVAEKSNVIVEIIAALFILLFLYTAINKSFDISNTVNVLSKTSFFSPYAQGVAWFVVVSEYIAAALLLIPKTRQLGLYISGILMVAFTVYISYMIIFVPHLPCTCGGVLQQLKWKQHLVFNISFTLFAILGICLSRMKNSKGRDIDLQNAVFT